MKSLLFAGGGTGGHLFPGLALADAIKRRSPENTVTFVGTVNGLDRDIVPMHGYALELISMGRGSPLSLKRPMNSPRFLLALWQSIGLLRRLRPDAVVALGGFAAAAPGIAARICGVPLVILEQNTIPGRTNRLLSRWAAQIHLQFSSARANLDAPAEIIHDSGSPIRAELAAFAAKPPVSGTHLLIMGGSQGAEQLNQLVLAAIGGIVSDCECPVIHIAGSANEKTMKQAYDDLGINARVHGFAHDMPGIYAAVRLAISRAGAGSLAELAAVGIPAILVPLPSAKDDHQRKNAVEIAATGGAVVMEQALASPDLLRETVSGLWHDASRISTMAKAIRLTAKPDAAERIAEKILSLANA